MGRPSRDLDRQLLGSGVALYAKLGYVGLPVRAVAAHAEVALA